MATAQGDAVTLSWVPSLTDAIATTEAGASATRGLLKSAERAEPANESSPVTESSKVVLKNDDGSCNDKLKIKQSRGTQKIKQGHTSKVQVQSPSEQQIYACRQRLPQSVMAMIYDIGVPMNSEPRALTWQRLEAMRCRKLGMEPRKYAYSRHFQMFNRTEEEVKQHELFDSGAATATVPAALAALYKSPSTIVAQSSPHHATNSLAPFTTMGKETCGVYFDYETEHRMMKTGIPPSNLVKWRNFNNSNAPHHVTHQA